MKKEKMIFYGFIIGLVNSFLGACGGIICVMALKKQGMNQRQAQANAIAVMLPLSIISSVLYIKKGIVNINSALIFIPGGIAGSLIGSYILPKVSDKKLKKIFAIFIIWAGIRMIMK